MFIGYARPTVDKTEGELCETLLGFGCDARNIYVEEYGNVRDRPILGAAIEELGPGDALVATSINQIARSTAKLEETVRSVRLKGADLILLQEGVDTRTRDGCLLFDYAALFHQFETEACRERSAEQLAKVRGKRRRVFGKERVDEDRLNEAIRLYNEGGRTIKQIVSETGVSQSTLYRRLNLLGIKRP